MHPGPQQLAARESGSKTVHQLRTLSSEDSLSVRSMHSSRDEMLDLRSMVDMPNKPACEVPFRLEGVKEGMRGESATQIRNRKGLGGYATKVDTPSGEQEELLQPNQDWLEQFAVVVQKQHRASSKGGVEIDMVRVQSPLVKAVLSEQLAAYPEFSNSKTTLPMDISFPFTPILHCWGSITKLVEEHPDPTTRDHLKILCDAFSEGLESPLKNIKECRSTGRIAYGSLWTIFKPGQLCYSKDRKGRECMVKVESAKYDSDGSNAESFIIDCNYVSWDGKRFGLDLARQEIYDTWNAGDLSSLLIIPIELHPDSEAIKAKLLKRGQKYASLTRTEVKVFTGRTNEVTRTHDTLRVGGRLLINPVGVRRTIMLRDLDPLVKENLFDKPLSEPSAERSPGSLRRQRERNCVPDLRKARDEWGRAKRLDEYQSQDLMLTEEQMMMTAPFLVCFDMSKNIWCWVAVEEIGDVPWEEDAYDDLVLPEDEKDLLLSVAESHVGAANSLEEKRRGTFICLNGPHGVGKTTAVQALAEKLHTPLYTVNIAECIRDFTEDYKEVEDSFVDALERCRKWNAIMHIKDLDFYLEKSLEKITRHDHVAMMTRHLTTHPGLVFLTTETASTIDPLLTSHFDLTIQVPALHIASRRKVWENAITQALPLRQRHFTSEHLERLAQPHLSGREICSVVKMALMAAQGKDEPLKMKHLERVLAIKVREGATA